MSAAAAAAAAPSPTATAAAAAAEAVKAYADYEAARDGATADARLSEVIMMLKGVLRPTPTERKPHEDRLVKWATTPQRRLDFVTVLLLLHKGPPQELMPAEWRQAVQCLQNVISRWWRPPTSKVPAEGDGPSDAEEPEEEEPEEEEPEEDPNFMGAGQGTQLRQMLLEAVASPNRARQDDVQLGLEAVVAQICRLDGLEAWPELMPRLLELAAATRSSSDEPGAATPSSPAAYGSCVECCLQELSRLYSGPGGYLQRGERIEVAAAVQIELKQRLAVCDRIPDASVLAVDACFLALGLVLQAASPWNPCLVFGRALVVVAALTLWRGASVSVAGR
jgi:hypothetical protein